MVNTWELKTLKRPASEDREKVDFMATAMSSVEPRAATVRAIVLEHVFLKVEHSFLPRHPHGSAPVKVKWDYPASLGCPQRKTFVNQSQAHIQFNVTIHLRKFPL